MMSRPPRIHREGWPFVALFAAAAALLSLLWTPLGVLGLVLTGWCAWFFRDPQRVTPDRAGLLISPADGVVTLIEPAVPPPELGLDPLQRLRVSIFMNVFDVHVNRSPIAGRVLRSVHRPGKFLHAAATKASDDNERRSWHLRLTDGRDLVMVQIAGLVARRIVAFSREGDDLVAGQRFGLIRFGSRVDVYLPEGAVPLVAEGQRMFAGETVLADLQSAEPRRPGRAA